jgi:hypothetical protein
MVLTFEERNRAPWDNVVHRKSELHGKICIRGVGVILGGRQTFIYILMGTLSALLAFPSTVRRVTTLSR